MSQPNEPGNDPVQPNLPPPPPGMPPAGMPPGGYLPQPVPQSNQTALIALVLALVAWPVCPVILAIVALVFASKAKKEIAASNGWQTGSGMVTAAKWIAWVNIIFYILLGILWVIIVIAAATVPSSGPSYNY
jgi:hypothetical protein